MTKEVARCKLCGAVKYINFAGLCKRCASSPKSLDVLEKVSADEKAQEALDAKFESHDQEDAKELQALEAKEDLTPEEKERIMELKPELISMTDVEDYLKKKHEHKVAEPAVEEASKEE